MPEVEITKITTKDVETSIIFNVYPEGEVGWVTHNRPSYDYNHNIDFSFKLRNNTDVSVMANFRLYNPYYEVATIYSIPIDAHKEFSYEILKILNDTLIDRLPVTFTAEAWIEGGEKHTVNFTVDEGNFLWISSQLQCRVEISGELKYQRPEEGLYIFPHDATVSLLATPPFCHVFKNWILEWKRSGASETKVQNPVEFTLTENCSATVYFEPTR
ncbi:MAG: hypothetical protein ACTSV7_02845 [Candidatus Baldrarchaeia archaeon]